MSPMLYNGDIESTPDYQTMRVWTRTLKKLRLVVALTGERMVAVMDRLVSEELQRHRTLVTLPAPNGGGFSA